jgi:undecaprenyl-diphosphatase
MTVIEGIILGLIQGLTEFLPVSSTGHLIITRQVMGLQGAAGLFFDAVLHLATLLAVVLYFRRDIWMLLRTVGKYLVRKPLEVAERAFFGAIVMGTIPAVVIGLLFENVISTSARSTFVVAWGLIFGSILMFLAERYKGSVAITMIRPRLGWKLGLFQALALFPGISRSGAVISGGLFSGLSRSDATRFAFVLSFPILLGAGGRAAFELLGTPFAGSLSLPLIAAFVTALASGILAIHFLLKFVRTRTLHPFIWYRVVLAVLLLLFPF